MIRKTSKLIPKTKNRQTACFIPSFFPTTKAVYGSQKQHPNQNHKQYLALHSTILSNWPVCIPIFCFYFRFSFYSSAFSPFCPSHCLRQSWFRRLSRNFRAFFVVQLFGDSRSQLCTVLCLIFLSLQMEGGPLHPWITQFSAYLAKFLSLAWGNDEAPSMVMNYDYLTSQFLYNNLQLTSFVTKIVDSNSSKSRMIRTLRNNRYSSEKECSIHYWPQRSTVGRQLRPAGKSKLVKNNRASEKLVR